jgi:hypothetical protein
VLLGEQGRVSIKGLMRELGLDQAGVEELIEELVDVQGVALRTDNVLATIGNQSAGATSAAAESALRSTHAARDPHARSARRTAP